MRGQRREGRTPSVEPELRFGSHTAVVFYPLILLKSHKTKLGYLLESIVIQQSLRLRRSAAGGENSAENATAGQLVCWSRRIAAAVMVIATDCGKLSCKN